LFDPADGDSRCKAVGYAIELIYAASGEEIPHEKIIRDFAVGVGFIDYGGQEEADETFPRFLVDKVRSPIH
jgi:hypothetical protein